MEQLGFYPLDCHIATVFEVVSATRRCLISFSVKLFLGLFLVTVVELKSCHEEL